ncbi:MAG: outer membrane beta-barrel protein [Elusimicrobiota bacterium]|nr:outer membrane beta-barrel protein [Elusimicrobiota bacterium]
MKNLLIAAVLLMPAAAGAQQNIKLGTMDVNPFMSTQESYDSNIYLRKTKPKGSAINRTSLGFELVQKVGSRLDLKGGYSMDILSYAVNTSTNNALHHNVFFSAMARLPKDMTVTVDDKYKQTTDQATSETTERATRVENIAGINFAAPLRGQFGFNVVVQNTYNNYLAGNLAGLDRAENLMGFDVTYKVQPKTKAFYSYRYGSLNYENNNTNDATYNNMDLGLTGDIAPKITGTVTAGMQARNYDKALGTAKDDITTMGYSAQAVWKAMAKSDVTIYGKRANVESNYGTSRFYTSTMLDIGVTRQINKIKAGLGFAYEGVQYPEKTTLTSPKRLDENTSVRLTAMYNIQKWLSADAGFTYKNRNSNEKANEYNDKVFSVGIKAMF